jgi:hypothetical protein
MKKIQYNIGDLIILKPNLWKDDIVRPGIIIELMYHNDYDEEVKSFFVLFNNAHPLIQKRICWHKDVLKHYPVIKNE